MTVKKEMDEMQDETPMPRKSRKSKKHSRKHKRASKRY